MSAEEDPHKRITIRPSFTGRIEKSEDGSIELLIEDPSGFFGNEEETNPDNQTLALTQRMLNVFEKLSFSEKEWALNVLECGEKLGVNEKKFVLAAMKKLAE